MRYGMLGCLTGLCACVARPPTIAHVHIGHAITAVHVTPDHKGYLEVAEQRASANVVRSAPIFAAVIAAVIGRCDYIDLLGRDVASSATLKEASVSAREILKLARAGKSEFP